MRAVDGCEGQGAVAFPSFGEFFRTFARIGLLSFGGPAGQIALMHRVLVEEKRWMSEERFLHALNFCMLLPGPEAQQLAAYCGWLMFGTRGGVVAGTLFVIPGFLVILSLSALYALTQSAPVTAGLFFGLKCAVLAIVADAIVRIGRRALRNGTMVALACASFVALFFFDTPFPVVVLAAGVFGYFGARARADLFAGPGHGGANALAGPYLDLREPEIASAWRHAARTLAAWGALWVAPVALLALAFGRDSVFTPIAAFFSKMAVVTFGGAYAALSYVAQLAVEDFGWLKPGEMLDGLAMAETTPGPLILVLTYVGFLAAFRAPPDISPLASGVIGAALTTWVTFVPCFLWIFLGAPYVERLRANKALSGALAAISAAVVGVIANLALWFALHVFFARTMLVQWGPLRATIPDFSTFDPRAIALAGVAAAMLFVLRLGILPVLALAGAAGVALRMV